MEILVYAVERISDKSSSLAVSFFSAFSASQLFRQLTGVQDDTKKRELLKNPTKIEEIQEKKLLTEIEPLQLAF